MFDLISKKIQSVDGIRSMSAEQLFYAQRWLDRGLFNDLDISDECLGELSLRHRMSMQYVFGIKDER